MRTAIRLGLLLTAVPLPPAPAPAAWGAEPPAESVLLVGWDGTRLERLQGLLSQGKLPRLQALIGKGSLLPVRANTKPDTKAGWAEIFTGYSGRTNRVKSNRQYDAIPKGMTLWERLREKFGGSIRLVFLSGKMAHLGNRGPHKVCANCIARTYSDRKLADWWNESSRLPTIDGKPRKFEKRGGEPYLHAARVVDLFRSELGPGERVMEEARKAFSAGDGRPFLAFVHFQEPDEQGHLYGEHSPEYRGAIEANDRRLGELLDFLKEKKLDTRLRVFVVGDHGFDVLGSGRPDDLEHDTNEARSTFLVTDRRAGRQGGDRRDLTPTLLHLFGIDPEKISPRLEGRSYFP